MPQPKRYSSDAERQRAYRERQKTETVATPADELATAFDAGYASEEAPLGRERPPLTAQEIALTIAWAEGVWQRLGGSEGTRRSRSTLARLERAGLLASGSS